MQNVIPQVLGYPSQSRKHKTIEIGRIDLHVDCPHLLHLIEGLGPFIMYASAKMYAYCYLRYDLAAAGVD